MFCSLGRSLSVVYLGEPLLPLKLGASNKSVPGTDETCLRLGIEELCSIMLNFFLGDSLTGLACVKYLALPLLDFEFLSFLILILSFLLADCMIVFLTSNKS